MTSVPKKWGRSALAVSLLIGGTWALGYGTARTQAGRTDTSELDRYRKRVAALTAENGALEAEQADTQRRLDICRLSIRRYQEELAHVDRINEALRRGDTPPDAE